MGEFDLKKKIDRAHAARAVKSWLGVRWVEGLGEGRVGGGGVVDGSSLGFVPRASGPMGVAAERETHTQTGGVLVRSRGAGDHWDSKHRASCFP